MSSENELQPVPSLHLYDVLLGRGSGAKNYTGNKRFRDIVKQHKQAYNLARKNIDKNRIARKVFDGVRSSGGRFLRMNEAAEPVENIVREGIWYECDDKIAMEKCRQALREKKPLVDTKQAAEVKAAPPSLPPDDTPSSVPTLSQPNLAPEQSVIDARLLLFEGNLSPAQPRPMLDLPNQVLSSAQPFAHFARNSSLLIPQQLPLRPHAVVPNEAPSDNAKRQHDACISNALLNETLMVTHPRVDMPVGSNFVSQDDSFTSDDDVSEYLLSVLALSGRSKFTDEQHEEEKANMTDEERAKVLCDLFGTYCSICHTKKAKRDLSKGEVAFLVKQMRIEIDKIPVSEKEALMEAQQQCIADEFSDSRLEQFLRCEGMDVKAGARRFACYWRCRKEVFREDYLLQLTLSEAIRNDIVALETGVFCLLPLNDMSGRTMLYLDPSRHTRDGYTTESLLRAIWYIIEIAAQRCNDATSRAVQVVWAKKLSLFDYESKIYDRMHYFEANAWPIRKCSFHVCCPESYTVRVTKPILSAVMDKESRARCLFHTVPESQLLSVLSDYGIHQEMLPVDMGGDLRLDQKEWIAQRRAAEMKEI